ncbi:hypothetical protein AAG906_007672 [Vitis piasezkii]
MDPTDEKTTRGISRNRRQREMPGFLDLLLVARPRRITSLRFWLARSEKNKQGVAGLDNQIKGSSD